MLLVLGIILTITGVGTAALIAFANGMSDSTNDGASLWPAGIQLALAAACFVARHFLHGAALHW